MYDDKIARVVQVLSEYPNLDPISIFGAGHWFHNEICPTSDVDIVVIVGQVEPAVEARANELLKQHQLDYFGKHPVHVRFFWRDELEGRNFGNSPIAPDLKTVRLYIRQFRFWKLLYGLEWPISSRILPPLPLEEELNYCLNLMFNLPSDGFLSTVQPTDEIFDWPDLLKLYLYIRINMAALHHNFPYTYSFKKVREFYSDNENDLIHNAYVFRQKGYGVDVDTRMRFYNRMIEELEAYAYE